MRACRPRPSVLDFDSPLPLLHREPSSQSARGLAESKTFTVYRRIFQDLASRDLWDSINLANENWGHHDEARVLKHFSQSMDRNPHSSRNSDETPGDYFGAAN